MGGDGMSVPYSCSYSYSCSYFYRPQSQNSHKTGDKWPRPHAKDSGIGDGTSDASNGVRERGIVDAAYGQERR